EHRECDAAGDAPRRRDVAVRQGRSSASRVAPHATPAACCVGPDLLRADAEGALRTRAAPPALQRAVARGRGGTARLLDAVELRARLPEVDGRDPRGVSQARERAAPRPF